MAVTKPRSVRRWGRWHFVIRVLGLSGLLAAAVGLLLLALIHQEVSWPSLQPDLNNPGRRELGLGLVAGGGLLALLALIVEIKAAIGMITGQRGAFASNVVLQVLLASALLAGVNAFSFKHYLRFDLTRDQQFTISDQEPDRLRSRLGQLRDKTAIVVLLRHVAAGQLGDKPDNYDSAAERKVVEKIRDLVDEFQEFGPQFEIQVLDVQEEGYQEKLEALTKDNPDLAAAIAATPENTIFFTANGKVSRLGFHDIFQLDKQSSLEADDGRGNLVLLDQGKMPFARKVLNLDEKRPRIALGVIHEVLSMQSSLEEYGMAGVKKALTARGFDTRDLILKRWGQFPPEPATMTYDEYQLERLKTELARLDSEEKDLKELRKMVARWTTASLADLNKEYADQLNGRQLTEEDRKLNLNRATDAVVALDFVHKLGLEEVTKKLEEEPRLLPRSKGTDLTVDAVTDTKVTCRAHNFVAGDVGKQILITAKTGWNLGLYEITAADGNAAILDGSPAAVGTSGGIWYQVRPFASGEDTLAELGRISDLHEKTKQVLGDCDLLILPRMTLRHVTLQDAIPNWLYQLGEPPKSDSEFGRALNDSGRSPQVEAIRDFLKAGKPLLVLFGPVNEPPGRMDPRMLANDHLEDDLARLGIKLGKQTILFNVESKSFAQRKGNLLVMGADVEVPPVEFDWPAGKDRPPGQTAALSSTPHPIRESLRLTARSLEKSQALDLRIRHPRPVYYVPTPGSELPYDPTIMMTNAACWNDDQPFPTNERVPHYEPSRSKLMAKESPDEMRTGPFPIGVAVESKLPADWYPEKNTTPAKVRVAAIGHGGVFVGPTLSPAKEKLLLDLCNWLLGRDDLLTKADLRWQYPRVALSDNDQALWQWGTRLGMPLLFAYLGLVVLLVRRLR